MSNQKLFTGDSSTVMVIRKVTDNITTLSVPFKRFGIVKFGGRGTIGTTTLSKKIITNPLKTILFKSDYVPALLSSHLYLSPLEYAKF